MHPTSKCWGKKKTKEKIGLFLCGIWYTQNEIYHFFWSYIFSYCYSSVRYKATIIGSGSENKTHYTWELICKINYWDASKVFSFLNASQDQYVFLTLLKLSGPACQKLTYLRMIIFALYFLYTQRIEKYWCWCFNYTFYSYGI